MTNPRRVLRNQIIALLDREAKPDSRNCSNAKANNYILTTQSGFDLRLMVEVYENPRSGKIDPPNIWFLKAAEKVLNGLGLELTPSLASELNRQDSESGRIRYGRHSGLKSVPQLVEADLVYVTPQTISDAEKLVAALKTFSP